MTRYRKYSKEFKLQAAKLITEQGYSCDQAAKQLGTTGWSDLNIHLIAEHGFFEGKGSAFRIEPGKLMKIIF